MVALVVGSQTRPTNFNAEYGSSRLYVVGAKVRESNNCILNTTYTKGSILHILIYSTAK